MNVIKKDGTLEKYDEQKIINAVYKASQRVMIELKDEDYNKICSMVWEYIVENNLDEIPIYDMHNIVEAVLEEFNTKIAKQYKEYRNYKKDFVHMLDKVYTKSQAIRYIGDNSNANTDSALVPTQRSLIYNELNSELYKKFFLNIEERQAVKDGYIYIHDRSARLDTMNCFAKETRFITSKGVKSFEDFKNGDIVFVPTHTGEWKKAIVHSYGKQKLQEVIVKRGSKGEKSVVCTKNHRWILKDGSDTTSLKIGDKLLLTPNLSQFEWEDLTKEQKKLWVYGFCMADGFTIQNSLNSWYSTIRLYGHKTEYIEMFEDAGFTVTYPNGLHGIPSVYIPNFKKEEFDPYEIEYEDVKYFITGYLNADGNRNLTYSSNSPYRGVQVTGENNKFIYDLLNISGNFVTRVSDLTNTSTNYGKRTDLTLSYGTYSDQGTRGWVVQDIKETTREEEVWCLEVEDNHSFILENGIVTGNCCLFNMDNVITGGFEMGNVWYTEPKTLDVAFDVISDVAMSASACQYGGFTIPRVDSILSKYAEKSYKKYVDKYLNVCLLTKEKAEEIAYKDVYRDMEQGFQSWEMRFNTVGSSRGDYPFISISFALDKTRFGQMATEVALKTRMKGQGKEGFKKPVLFPKLTFLYDENLHGEGKELEYLFDIAIECSKKSMYPDFLSLTGEGYIPSIYKKYGKVISLMGCRASLSPWYEKGGIHPLDENDIPVFEGRMNLGAISLHLPMILAKARQENKDFYEVLDYYLELIRNLHKKTLDYLGEKKASTNPLAYCQGGFYGGNLKPDDKIKSLLKPMTMSFGITALNELQYLYNKKTLVQDSDFAYEVMVYINKKLEQYKEEDGILYAIYGTPAESLAGTQVEQFRKKYGIIEGVSDREYVTNSFHCAVWEDISPIQKQDLEHRFWNLFNGGKIQYCRYPINYNTKAIKTLVRRAMDMGYYEGINMSLSYCEKCGYEQLEMDVCPKCGSELITKIDRMNGYLGYTEIHGKTRYNNSKNAEIKERVSM